MTAMTLTEFLLARIAEDEDRARVARGAYSAREHDPEHGESFYLASVAGERVTEVHLGTLMEADPRSTALVYHLAEWLPGRVLAECEAKRRIVELHPLTPDVVPVDTGPTPSVGCETCHTVTASSIDDVDYVEALGGCDTLLTLALPYANHPAYRDEW